MLITRQIVADELGAYLSQRASLGELVEWAERQVMEGEFESEAVRDAVTRLGVADVRAFGLEYSMIHSVGSAAVLNTATPLEIC